MMQGPFRIADEVRNRDGPTEAGIPAPAHVIIGGRLVGIVALAAVLGWTQNAQGSVAPELGVTWTFDCGPDSPWNERYTFTPEAIEGDVLLMKWTAGDQTGSLSAPVSMRLTDFHAKKVLGDKTTRQVIEQGKLSFETLEVGEQVTALVRQFDSMWGRNRWQWRARITDRITVETTSFGTLDVLVIEINQYSQEWSYGATKITHFSPELNFPVYWKYSDTNNDAEECRLVSRDPPWRPPGTTRKASGEADDRPPVRSRNEVEVYLEENEWEIRHKLEAYNRRHRVLVGNNNTLSVKMIHSTQVLDLHGDSVLLEMNFQVGRPGIQWTAGVGTFVFELKWIGDELEFVAHQTPPTPMAGLASTGAAPVKSRREVEAYLDRNELEIRRKLEAYNRKHRVLVGNNNILGIKKAHVSQIMDLHGDKVVLEIDFQLGRPGAQWTAGTGRFLFELEWMAGELEFVAHSDR